MTESITNRGTQLFGMLSMLLLLPALQSLADDTVKPRAKSIAGWIETVEILDAALTLDAKLDTGAATSSLDAREIRRFRRGKKRLVSFKVAGSKDHKLVFMEKPLQRTVRIKRHDGSYQRRAVVILRVCLGSYEREIEVSLIDRENFEYPLLLGRNALEGIALVDAELQFTLPADCAMTQVNE